MDTHTFTTQADFAKWLHKNHSTSKGVWIRFLKKAHKESSGEKSINYAEALDVVLCYGWIDSTPNKLDEISYIQKFTLRSPRSIWSKRNREHVARLVKEKSMTSAGLAHVDAAKKDGRWALAYDSAATMKIPEDFLRELSKFKKAEVFFKTLNKSNLYAIGFRLQTAKKAQTREKRMQAILDLLKKARKII